MTLRVRVVPARKETQTTHKLKILGKLKINQSNQIIFLGFSAMLQANHPLLGLALLLWGVLA